MYTAHWILGLSVCRSELFRKVHYFIHLNLSISLFLGYLMFVAGIETARANHVSSWSAYVICEAIVESEHSGCVNIDYRWLSWSVNGIRCVCSSQGACVFVAVWLHYFFLASFCWMLCEGIMLYLMLVVVFSKLSEKWWFFLLLGYGECCMRISHGLSL